MSSQKRESVISDGDLCHLAAVHISGVLGSHKSGKIPSTAAPRNLHLRKGKKNTRRFSSVTAQFIRICGIIS